MLKVFLTFCLIFFPVFVYGADAESSTGDPIENVEVAVESDLQSAENGASSKLQRMKERFARNESGTGEVSEVSEVESPSYSKALQGLMLCLGVFFISVYVMKKMGAGEGGSGSSRLALRERLSLGGKSSVVIVQVDGKDILLGVTETNISHLEEIPAKRKRMKQAPITLESSQVVPCINE